jgi:hypothetical protein
MTSRGDSAKKEFAACTVTQMVQAYPLELIANASEPGEAHHQDAAGAHFHIKGLLMVGNIRPTELVTVYLEILAVSKCAESGSDHRQERLRHLDPG